MRKKVMVVVVQEREWVQEHEEVQEGGRVGCCSGRLEEES